jgi:hypothetical protein
VTNDNSSMPLFGRPGENDERREAAYREWFARQHPLALASLIFSVFSLTHFGTLWVDEIAGIVLGAIVLRRLAAGDERQGFWLAVAGVAVGVISLTCAFVIYFVLPHST